MELSRNQIVPDERKFFMNPLYVNDITGEVGCQEDFELVDGRRRWKDRKNMSLKVSALMGAYDIERADKIRACGRYLVFSQTPDGKKTLQSADFCRERMCPMCQWRRAIKLSVQADKIFKALTSLDYRFIFITLTVRNVSGDDLNNTCDELYEAFTRFSRTQKYKSAICGCYRALEITYNSASDTYHPHFHCLCAVKPDYFDCSNYVSKDELIRLWRRSARLDYDPSVDIEVVKQKEGQTITSACVEMCKYPCKSAEINSSRALQYIDYALRGRRLITWLGCMADIRRALKIDDNDDDLIHTDELSTVDDAEIQKIAYVWRSGLYLPVDVHRLNETERN